MIDAGLIAARIVHYVGLALLFGSWAYAGFAGGNDELSRLFRRLSIAAALLVLLGSLGVLATTIAGLAGDLHSLADGELWTTVLQDTDFGRVWIVRLIIAVIALGLACCWSVSGLVARVTGVILAGALATTLAWTGHAAILEGAAGLLHRWSDALHLVAAVVWIGALLPMLWLLTRPSTAAQAVRRLSQFHAIGLAAVLTLLVTGTVNSYFLVGTPVALFTTGYGQLLALKLALFACMVALAAANRFRLVPALQKWTPLTAGDEPKTVSLRRSIGCELALGFCVLAIVAWLGTIAPAAS